MPVLAHVLAAVLLATNPTAAEVKPTVAAAQVRAVALPLAEQLRVTLGKPACPSSVPVKTGAVFQCTVPFGDVAVPFLVQIDAGGTLSVTQPWAVLTASTAAYVAGPKAKCGTHKVLTGPVGSTITCTVAGKQVKVLITSLTGGVVAVPPR